MGLVKLTVGDWSDDGHGKIETYNIVSNLTKPEIEIAYQEGCKIIGFDLVNDCCEEYEDSTLRGEYIEKLREHKINIKFFESHENPEDDILDGVRIDASEFTKIYLEICKLGNPNSTYQLVHLDEIEIGGYGLFY